MIVVSVKDPRPGEQKVRVKWRINVEPREAAGNKVDENGEKSRLRSVIVSSINALPSVARFTTFSSIKNSDFRLFEIPLFGCLISVGSV